MLVVSSREFRDSQKKYLELSQNKRVVIKRKNEFIELIHRGHSIPENPHSVNEAFCDSPKSFKELRMRIVKLEEKLAKRNQSE